MLSKRIVALSILLLLSLLLGLSPRTAVAETPPPPPQRIYPPALEQLPQPPTASALPSAAASQPQPQEGESNHSDPNPNALTMLVMSKYVEGGGWELFWNQVYSLQQTQITTHPANDIFPSIEPGIQQRVAFVSNRDGNLEIYRTDLWGALPVRLTANAALDSTPDWGPGQSGIIFVSQRDENAEIYRMNPDGSQQTRLTDYPGSDFSPSWSPDGKQIAWVRAVDDHTGMLLTMNADGSGITQITQPLLFLQNVNWSRTGNQLVFSYDSNMDGWYDIGRVNSDSSDLETIYTASEGTDLLASSGLPWDRFVCNELYYVHIRNNWYLHSTIIRYRDLNSYGAFDVIPSNNALYAKAANTDPLPPQSSVAALPRYVLASQPALIYYSAVDVGLAGVQHVMLQGRIGETGQWFNIHGRDASLSSKPVSFTGTAGNTYYFRSQATDLVGNVEIPSADGNPFTSFYSWLLTGRVTDARGIPLRNVTPTLSKAFETPRTNAWGRFISHIKAEDVDVAVQKPGYLTSLTTRLLLPDAIIDREMGRDWILAGTDNQVQDGSFEETEASPWKATNRFAPVRTKLAFDSLHAAQLGNTEVGTKVVSEKIFSGWMGITSDMTRDAQGNYHIVFNDSNSLYYVRGKPGETWPAAKPIFAVPAGASIAQPNVEIGPDGVYVVWGQKANSMYLGILKYAFSADGDNWTLGNVGLADEQYNCQLNDTCKVKFTVDNQGGMHVIAEQSYFYKPAGAEWQPRDIPGVFYLQDVAVDTNGQVFIAASQHVHSRPIGSTGKWIKEQDLPLQDGCWNNFHALAVDAQGQLHESWVCDHIYYRSLSNDGVWSPITDINALDQDRATSSWMVVQPDGQVYLVWLKAKDGYYQELGARSWLPGQGWGVSTLIHLNLPEYLLALAPDGSGGLYALWEHPVTSGYVEPELQVRQFKVAAINQMGYRQTLQVPASMHKPTLSFAYQLKNSPTTSNSGDTGANLFQAWINQTPVFTATAGTTVWEHAWVDVSDWQGQPITLTFRLDQSPAAFTLVNLDAVSLSSWNTPVVTSISKHVLLQWAGEKITLSGENFMPGALVKLGTYTVTSVMRVDENTLEITLPAWLPAGMYLVQVINQDGVESNEPILLQLGHRTMLPLVAR